jgi:hypothetical protein
VLARLAWVSDEPRQQAQALWTQGALEVRGVAEPNVGSGRLSAQLLGEAKRACDHSLTPDLIALYLPQVKSRSVQIDHLMSLTERAPVGPMRGEALMELAELEAYDAPERGLQVALEAAKHHQPNALKLAERLYLKAHAQSLAHAQPSEPHVEVPESEVSDEEPAQVEKELEEQGEEQGEALSELADHADEQHISDSPLEDELNEEDPLEADDSQG